MLALSKRYLDDKSVMRLEMGVTVLGVIDVAGLDIALGLLAYWVRVSHTGTSTSGGYDRDENESQFCT
jgi:hypothetical protein